MKLKLTDGFDFVQSGKVVKQQTLRPFVQYFYLTVSGK